MFNNFDKESDLTKEEIEDINYKTSKKLIHTRNSIFVIAILLLLLGVCVLFILKDRFLYSGFFFMAGALLIYMTGVVTDRLEKLKAAEK